MYERILVPIDGSEAAALGLAEAIKVAKGLGGSIRLVTIVTEVVMVSGFDAGIGLATLMEGLRLKSKKLLESGVASVRSAGVPVDAEFDESFGSHVGTKILQHASAWPADLIVMGTHGRRGIRRMVLGSDAEFVVRHAPVPVLLVRSPQPPSA